MRYSVALILVLSILSSVSSAQNARVRKYTTALEGKVVMSELGNKYNPHVYNIEMPEPDGAADAEKLAAIKDLLSKQYPHRSTSERTWKTTSILPPVISINFLTDSTDGIPPDNYMAISKHDSAVVVKNEVITTFYAPSATAAYSNDLQGFSTPVGLQNFTDNRFDPKVIYDPEADRFICLMLNLNFNNYSHSYVVVGFSQSSDPSGAWNFYKFYGNFANDTTFFDYPCLSITHHELFITGNKVRNGVSWQTGFKESVIYQVRKQDGYIGDSVLNYQLWDSIMYHGSYIRNVYPLKGSGSIGGPSQYLVGNRILDMQNDTVFLVKIPDTIGSANNNLVVTPLISNIPYGVPPNGRQPDTSLVLMTNDGRILGGYIQNSEIQFVSTSIDTNNGAAAIYHGTISHYSTSPLLTAHIYSVDSLDFGYPNISYAGNPGGINQSIISFDYTGPHTYPGFGAVFYDGSQYSSLLKIKTGDSTIHALTGKEQRWGDYSGSQPDWKAIGCVWVAGLYGRKDQNYGNYLARLVSPLYTGVNKVETIQNKALLYPNPSHKLMQVSFQLEKDQVVNFIIYNAMGQVVDKLLSQYCKDGRNIIQFNVGPLASGTYFLKAIDEEGKILSVNTFIRQ